MGAQEVGLAGKNRKVGGIGDTTSLDIFFPGPVFPGGDNGDIAAVLGDSLDQAARGSELIGDNREVV